MLRPFLLSASIVAAAGCTTLAEFDVAEFEAESESTTSVEASVSNHPEPGVVKAPILTPPQAVAVVPTIEEQPAVEEVSQESQELVFENLPASDWTVQIAALRDLERIGWIEVDYLQGQNVLHVPTYHEELGALHTVLVGTYNTYEEAAAAALRLPRQVAGDEPWIRSVASVQAVMRK